MYDMKTRDNKFDGMESMKSLNRRLSKSNIFRKDNNMLGRATI